MKKLKRPNIITPQLGYFCDARKTCLVKKEDLSNPAADSFFLQCLERNYPDPNSEAWEIVLEIKAEPAGSPLGEYLKGDFSRATRPGFYRVTTAGSADYSYPFLIHDDAYGLLPSALLDYLHAQRCGEVVPGYHGACHLDDGVRSDSGAFIDTRGGWHDAGDCRKWMAYSMLPVRGLHRLRTEYGFSRSHFTAGKPYDDLAAEILHGVRFMLKMQDPGTGMFYEDVGGGRVIDAAKPWWAENFSGCAASNQDNRFTDNLPMSGDERAVRVQYNPVVQWMSIALLCDAAEVLADGFPDAAAQAVDAADRCFRFMDAKAGDDLDGWTVVRAWKLSALVNLTKRDNRYLRRLETAVTELLENQHTDAQESDLGFSGFWFKSDRSKDPYKTPVYAAQPAIALLEFLDAFPDHERSQTIKTALTRYFERYLFPMAGLSPFEIIPYGLYHPVRQGTDHYHKAGGDWFFRFFVPTDTDHKIVIGLSGHLLSHAQSLGLAFKIFHEPRYRDLALKQIEWVTGFNPFRSCLVYGFGFNNPVPHSRFLGPLCGGVYNGYAGDARDRPVLDLDGGLAWNTTEFWNPHCAHLMAALSYILIEQPETRNRIGIRTSL